jgi:L-malate glycosyltransferase
VKILQLVQKPQLRGAEMFAAQLATHLNQMGHEALLVFVFPGEAALPFSGKTFHLNGTASKRFFDRAAWRRLAEFINREKPDIIQANAGDTLKYAVSSKLRYGWKQPIVFRNASTISLYIKSLLPKLFNGFFFRYTDMVISVSKTSAADFKAVFPRFSRPVITIPIGIEEPGLENVTKPDRKTGDPINIIHVGGFSFEKNHKGLVNIFQKLGEKGYKVSLGLVGNGPLRPGIEKMVAEKGFAENIKFYGFRNDAMVLIKQADILVLPSIIEGLPGVILEAFYCRTPVVAYNVGGIGEILLNGKTGALINKGDESAFADAIISTVENSVNNDDKETIENAYKLVTDEYLNTAIAAKFLAAYRELTGQKKS